MAHTPFEGTRESDRSDGYQQPSRDRRVLRGTIAAATLLSVVLVGLYLVGIRQPLSPGPLSRHHSSLDGKCIQCHETGNAVVDLRCERCHDPGQTDRFINPSHVRLGGDRLMADRAEMTPCATCHTDHQGRMLAQSHVEDRECVRCHTDYPSLARHPEFPIVKAAAMVSRGMKFTHKTHLEKYLPKDGGGGCERCHQPTGDNQSFGPTDFDQHCARCHTKNGLFSLPVDDIQADLIVTPDKLPDYWRQDGLPQTETTRGSIRASGLRHRDGWVLANALRLRQAIDPEGDAMERQALWERVASLQNLDASRPTSLSDDDIAAAIKVAQLEIKDFDQRLAAPAPADAAGALSETRRSIAALADEIQQKAGTPGDAATVPNMAQGSPESGPIAAAAFAQRKAELLTLLATIGARATLAAQAKGTSPSAMVQRITALRDRVNELTLPTTPTGADENESVLARLVALESTVSILKRAAGPSGRLLADQLDFTRRYALQQAGGGLSLDRYLAEKSHLLSLLDAVALQATTDVKARVNTLRARVAALQVGATASDWQRLRASRQKSLDRLLLEQRLRRDPDVLTTPLTQAYAADAGSKTQLDASKLWLSRLSNMPAPGLMPDPAQRGNYQAALNSLLSTCVECHEYDSSGARLAPVRIDDPIMPQSVFNHGPHTKGTTCESCHTNIRKSDMVVDVPYSGKSVTADVNEPGVANCQTCHRPSNVRATCDTCHVYHPRSVAAHLLQ